MATKIYTKTGDKGRTGLWGGARVSKAHPRIRAYGEVDELNSAIGTVLASLPPGDHECDAVRAVLRRVQGELFVLGAQLAGPGKAAKLPFDPDRMAKAAGALEREIDGLEAGLEPLKAFILPGGALLGALLHLARAVCRRAERAAVELAGKEALRPDILVYLNRLSDYLFVAARWVNKRLGARESAWGGGLR